MSLESELNALAQDCHRIAVDHGWWEAERNDGEMLCLVHSEISELCETLRHGNPPSEHIPSYSGAEEEAADVVIRLLDLCYSKGWDLAGAIQAKVEFNRGRSYRHNGKLF